LQALELDSKDAKARYRRGIAYERQGKLQEAYVDLSLASKGGQGEASKAMNVLQAKIQRRGEELPRSV